jgi:hypothetical protein
MSDAPVDCTMVGAQKGDMEERDMKMISSDHARHMPRSARTTFLNEAEGMS